MAASLEYMPLEKLPVPRPVDRIEYIQAACAGKKVLDLGAMDETAFKAKRGTGTWLHEEISKVAAEVIGIDSSELVPQAGLRTSDRSIIYQGDVGNIRGFLDAHDIDPDIIVAGELIEHVPNPLQFLQSIATVASLTGKTLLLTTPNATAMHNFLIALTKRESAHPDHLCILSYKTMNTLFLRAKFTDWKIQPYLARFTEMKLRTNGVRRSLVSFCESTVNAAETLFPLVSFGLIGHVTI